MANTTDQIPFGVRRAARKFAKERADYFDFLADVIEGSEGKLKFQQIFERDSDRFKNRPRGVLSRYWSENFSENGASLRSTWAGAFPDDELAILDVAQEAGGGAIITTLRDVASGVRLKQKVQGKAKVTAFLGGLALLLAFLMTTAYPIVVSNFMRETFSMVPEEYYRPVARKWFAYSNFITYFWPFVASGFLLSLIAIRWSIDNMTGRFREWLDKSNFLYRAIRDTRSVMFLTTLATISKQRGTSSMPLKKALLMFKDGSQSKWFNWRIFQILENIDRSGGVSSDVFNTNILSEEMFFYLRDMEQARGFSAGFAQTSVYVKERLLDQIEKRLKIYLYVSLILSGVIVFSVSSAQMVVLKSLTASTKLYYSDGK